MGMGNTAGTISGIVAPYVIRVLTKGINGQSVKNWQTVFLISAGLYGVASILMQSLPLLKDKFGIKTN